MTVPFTDTRFSPIKTSASRLEQSPDLAMTFAIRSPFGFPSSGVSSSAGMIITNKKS